MKLGKVTEKLTVAQAPASMREQKLLTVELEGSHIVALDCAGAAPGDRVLVVMGHAASRYSMESPVDAVVAAVVRQEQ